ncbi:transposase [Kiloniella litopenaei]|uniref:transposase n=1 Tax=Kiloniella litopenaei TaxID=1549748 RepID=UPI003BAD7FB8
MVKPGTVLYADDNTTYDALDAQFEVNPINHSESYTDDVACTNGTEGWFSRFRDAKIGQNYHIAGKYYAFI